MQFFVDKNSTAFDDVMSPDTLMKSDAAYYGPRFDAIKDLRAQDDGTLHKGQGFRRVASFVNVPMMMAMKVTDPDFLKDKRKFYAFIDRHPEYCTYQRRNGGRPTAKDDLKLPLKALGIDYPGNVEDFEPVIEEIVVPELLSAEAPVSNAEVIE